MLKQNRNVGRRNFIQFAARAAIVLPVADLFAVALSGCGREGRLFAQRTPADNSHKLPAPSKITVVPEASLASR